MLTHLKVSGFKNLVDVDVRFGPFTCIAGANGVGKSNLFDAIHFLSALADRPLNEAALSVRDEGGRTADIRSLFHRVGDKYDDEMTFDAEMIVPSEGYDDLGQKAKATITFLRYRITIAYRSDDSHRSLGSLELRSESLTHINLGEASRHLLFGHSASTWRKDAVKGRRGEAPFISTELEGAERVVKIHQDGGNSGRPLSRLAANLPRTVLSVANAAESPTALLAKREMQSWRLLQLEPSSLRKPDLFSAPARLGTDGSHLAATLYRLASEPTGEKSDPEDDRLGSQVFAQVANRLAELIEDVREVSIDRDDRRELLTLQVTGRDGTAHYARSLSDGTLRFLALAVLELDPKAQGVLCLEEPENGIHPERLPAMLRLLQSIAMDVTEPVGPDNPLRQVIVNTHSPAVVSQIPDDSLLIAEAKEAVKNGQRFNRVCFSCLSGTWRAEAGDVPITSKGKLLSYLNPVSPANPLYDSNGNGAVPATTARSARISRRVVDREDLQPALPFYGDRE